jgi:hypothetical protein
MPEQVMQSVRFGEAEAPAGRDVRLIGLCRRSADKHRCLPEFARRWDLVDANLQDKLTTLAQGGLHWPLFLWGDVGAGKTAAVLAFCDLLEAARYWTVGRLLTDCDSRHPGQPPWEMPWGAKNGTPQLAVLDELGRDAQVGRWEYDCVQAFADWRIDQPAIYVSNHGPKEIARRYDFCDRGRVESRLTCGTVHELTGPDRRKS